MRNKIRASVFKIVCLLAKITVYNLLLAQVLLRATQCCKLSGCAKLMIFLSDTYNGQQNVWWHLTEKFNFEASWKHFPHLLTTLQNNVDFSIFLRLHRPQSLHNIKLGGWHLNIQKVSFSQSFLTTFYFCCPM